ncbi:hypothetical protein DBR37_05750 [Herminiimonas sp. KBW02]|nr:hypothetical protein DBR37_05750 [Herminiimonas sp. KBW02]
MHLLDLFAGAGGFFIGEMMSLDLADIFDAVGKLVVIFDQHPIGAAFLIILTALIGILALVWRLKR